VVSEFRKECPTEKSHDGCRIGYNGWVCLGNTEMVETRVYEEMEIWEDVNGLMNGG
jgi:hypothetical protein